MGRSIYKLCFYEVDNDGYLIWTQHNNGAHFTMGANGVHFFRFNIQSPLKIAIANVD